MRTHVLALLALLPACADDAQPPDEQEVITTVILQFTANGGQPVEFEFDDPDGDGGAAPTADTIMLNAGGTFSTRVRFENRLETPPEDITVEIEDESDQHQVFFTGSAISGGVLTQMATDMDANGLPIGLTSSVSTPLGGTGDLVVTLRHLPPINGQPTKTAGLETQVRNGGFDGIPGESDAQVTFPVTVLSP